MSGFTWHGGRLAEARAYYGGDRWIDLSTGINPEAWPGADALPVDWRGLPDPEQLRDLEAAAAAHFGVGPGQLCTVPGSEMGLRLIGRLIDLPARYFVPSYRTHGEIFADSRAIADLAGPPEEPVALLLANPNNPDGRVVPAARLRLWLDWLEREAGWLIVDEAYADALPDCSMAGEAGDDRRLILLRSFGKFFGLAGVRLGFLIGPRWLVAQARSLLGEWPVSAAAVTFGRAAYRDRSWIEATVAGLRQRAAGLDLLLAKHGLAGRGDCPLFRLIEVEDGFALFDHFARHAILTRPFEENRRWLRIGLPRDEEERMRLDEALANV